MAKKKKLESKAPVPMTRGQLSRAQRERQQIRNLYTAGVAVATLVVLVIGIAVVTTFFINPNREVARVNSMVITRATYDKLRRWSLFQQIQNEIIQQQLGAATGGSTDLQSTDALAQQLRNVSNEALDPDTVSQLIDNEVLRQKSASDFSLSPSQQDLRAYAVKDFVPQPTEPPAPTEATTPVPTTITGTATITPTATATWTPGPPTNTPTVTPTLLPVPGAQQTAETTFNRYLGSLHESTAPHVNDNICAAGCPDLTESDYLNLIIDPRYRKEQVTDKLAATGIVTDVEQVNAQRILTDTQEGAQKLHDMLDKGADFTQLANEQSSEQINNVKNGSQPNGGNLGWFPQQGSNFDQTFVDAAFKVEKGKYSEPVQTSFGWHIIKVLDRAKRPLTQDQIDAAKTKLYDDWFQKARESSVIIPVPTPSPLPTQPLAAPTSPPQTPSAPAGTPGTPGTPGSEGRPTTGTITTTGTLTNTGDTTNTDTQGVVPTAKPTP
jgi:parvulin-like peptidyl-prolyl isomerase